jgi:hypothetical protein
MIRARRTLMLDVAQAEDINSVINFLQRVAMDPVVMLRPGYEEAFKRS